MGSRSATFVAAARNVPIMYLRCQRSRSTTTMLTKARRCSKAARSCSGLQPTTCRSCSAEGVRRWCDRRLQRRRARGPGHNGWAGGRYEASLYLGVPSYPEPPRAPRGGTGAELGRRQGVATAKGTPRVRQGYARGAGDTLSTSPLHDHVGQRRAEAKDRRQLGPGPPG